MPLHATAKTQNIHATLWAHLNGLSLTGSPTLIGADDPGQEAITAPAVRVLIDTDQGTDAGEVGTGGTDKAYRTPVIVTLDLFYGSGEAASSGNLYTVALVADELADAFTLLSLQISDYATDPVTPAAVAGAYILFTDPPVHRRLPPADGFTRRQVTAEGAWFLRHTI
jgi:hypothetical protein